MSHDRNVYVIVMAAETQGNSEGDFGPLDPFTSRLVHALYIVTKKLEHVSIFAMDSHSWDDDEAQQALYEELKALLTQLFSPQQT
ncbi:MAG: hypothetical protein C7B46_16420 [Sulfobacillus benefaciens]|uniref:Uncharacterized protein n=1 Tax=Sulfobacillus benefaciens TaxID=453960 RepID=A0A2T2XBY6_9FIRM|nr:MAG: hypothetical protein C7B46_16420 [Sulfobacillus benefaciens]